MPEFDIDQRTGPPSSGTATTVPAAATATAEAIPAPAAERADGATATLVVKGLTARVEGKDILKGVDLEVPQGEIHALMGPNGSGKSTLAYTLMGHPAYEVTGGSASFDGQDLLSMPADERARLGIFLSFQYPTAIPGVSTVNFLRAALRAQGKEMPARAFMQTLNSTMSQLKFDESFRQRYINDGFSGGEKKRAEILQMEMLKPRLAILDETDSGLDVDALRTVAEAILRLKGPDVGILVITHYPRILEYLEPDRVHVMHQGRVILSGDRGLAQRIEAGGYEPIIGAGAAA
ncbi:MAG TPA: Fe-S cluster assembly ATPase SufC [Candidatus Sulfotelmatobacter sp.]|nr:Fe-S cluster assembly ATPase SufC [Candidatus Sulfotelmatobacter sp.]